MHGKDELDALFIFQNVFGFSKIVVAPSKSRTLLESAEPPLQFTIEVLSSPFAQNVEASLVAAIIFNAAKETAKAIASAYRSLAERFPNRRIQLLMRISKPDASVPSYPLSADLGTLEKQVAGIALDLKNGNTLQRASESGMTMAGCRRITILRRCKSVRA